MTADWCGLLTPMQPYHPFHLIKLCGPVAVGVYLHTGSSNSDYVPTAHIHCLLRSDPAISLAAMHRLKNARGAEDAVRVALHDEYWRGFAERLLAECAVLEDRPLSLQDVLQQYRNRLKLGEHIYQAGAFTDIVLLLHWGGYEQHALDAVEFFVVEMERWPSSTLQKRLGIDTWRNEVELQLVSQEELDAVLKQHIQDLKLAKHSDLGLSKEFGPASFADFWL